MKEQSGAYVDWQKQSNKYGANAEAMASQGLTHSGYSESSQVSMYNTYQNRIATARESHEIAKMNFTNAIKDAQLQNSSALAEIALKAYEQQAQLSIQMVTSKNQLLAQKLEAKQQTHQIYRQQYQDVLDQINKERQEAIQKEQFEREMALAEQKFQEEKRQAQVQEALDREMFEYTKAKASSGGSGGSGDSGGGNNDVPKFDDSKTGGSDKGELNNTKAVQEKKTVTQQSADEYGTFSNGYQPKGIVGYGKLSKTGDTCTVNGNDQNVWKTPDGTKWYWDGSSKQYKVFTATSSKNNGSKAGAVAGGIASTLKNSSKK